MQSEYREVTYDLNVAKPAMKIHPTESPKFSNVLLRMGVFPVEMAFLTAIRKLLSESGGPDILTEFGVLSLDRFI